MKKSGVVGSMEETQQLESHVIERALASKDGIYIK